ncbi:MAG: PHP domain-containing protein [Gemmatimonadota bacterium]
MKLDLHLHSTASDGRLDPSDLVALASSVGLDVVALADHDTVAGVATASRVGKDFGLAVIPALEVSCTRDDTEIHVLGYFIDPTNPALVRHGDIASRMRAERLREMVQRLGDQGVEVSFESVVETAGEEVSSLGRPHLARVLVDAGHVDTIPEAFDRYIGNDHAAYVPTRLLTPEESIRLIHGAGGLAVWAHPPLHLLDDFLSDLVKAGLDGLEVFRPGVLRSKERLLLGRAQAYGLVVTGGSDWHGPDHGELGTFSVSESHVSDFLDAAGWTAQGMPQRQADTP